MGGKSGRRRRCHGAVFHDKPQSIYHQADGFILNKHGVVVWRWRSLHAGRSWKPVCRFCWSHPHTASSMYVLQQKQSPFMVTGCIKKHCAVFLPPRYSFRIIFIRYWHVTGKMASRPLTQRARLACHYMTLVALATLLTTSRSIFSHFLWLSLFWSLGSLRHYTHIETSEVAFYRQEVLIMVCEVLL